MNVSAASTESGVRAQTASEGQGAGAGSGTLVFRSALERDLANEVMCTCGCRLPAGTCGMMNCEGKAAQLGKIKTLVGQGLTREQVIDTFVQEAGGQFILSRPKDEGFHRLLWLMPYTLAALTALGLAVIARRWATGRAGQPGLGAPAAAADAGLQQRLDDELRDLD